MGAGCTYEDLVGSNSAKNIIITIKKEFPWWGELHGWWCMNPAYNNTWSANVSRQDFAKHVVELFELWPNPLGGDPSFSSPPLSPLPPVASKCLSLASSLSSIMPGSPAVLSAPPSVFNKGNSISLNDDPPFPFLSPCPKIQLKCLSLEQDQALLKPSFIQEFQQVQQQRSEAKHHQLQYGYLEENEKSNSCLAGCEHQIVRQHEQHVHGEVMAAQELEKIKLSVKLEEL
ncbi:hypothetical protein F5J12DRAFT_784792 [Pisolithus orientalis]|uniref:uncharacterized protein n=1 Tax=Pisolithus orientalis TaxID=936130 RepID=UPI0022241DBB|nr:uncharacterized protein F5J12DRAFT_784792 [Pisolithus orientalis]KAI5998949.1 hypothetical protein F5J12DRAFT_784792 [Pisolithus orientalis]